MTSLLQILVWWPALAILCVAAWPHSGVGTVAGIGLVLLALGLVDFGLEHGWRRRAPGVLTQRQTDRGNKRFRDVAGASRYAARSAAVPLPCYAGVALI